MTSAKFTPGPWLVAPADEWTTSSGEHAQFGRYDISAGSVDPEASNYYRIASVSNVNNADANKKNARLIAAAPDLAQALADLIEAADSMAGTFGCIRGDTPEDADTHTHDQWAEDFLKERADAARAAIAKATGEGA